jgi:hypothetical protein
MKKYYITLIYTFSLAAMERPPQKPSVLSRLASKISSLFSGSVSETSVHAHPYEHDVMPHRPNRNYNHNNIRNLTMTPATPEQKEKYKKEAAESDAKLLAATEAIIAHHPEKIDAPHPEFYNQPLLFRSVQSDSRLEVTKMLLNHGANIHIKRPGSNVTPLFTAVFDCSIETVKELITRKTDLSGHNFLHTLCYHAFDRLYPEWPAKRLALWTVLLDAGIDPNEKDSDNNTCLYNLLHRPYKEFFEKTFIENPETKVIFIQQRKSLIALLLERGLNPETKNKDDKTALEYATQNVYSLPARGEPELIEFVQNKITSKKIG